MNHYLHELAHKIMAKMKSMNKNRSIIPINTLLIIPYFDNNPEFYVSELNYCNLNFATADDSPITAKRIIHKTNNIYPSTLQSEFLFAFIIIIKLSINNPKTNTAFPPLISRDLSFDLIEINIEIRNTMLNVLIIVIINPIFLFTHDYFYICWGCGSGFGTGYIFGSGFGMGYIFGWTTGYEGGCLGGYIFFF